MSVLLKASSGTRSVVPPRAVRRTPESLSCVLPCRNEANNLRILLPLLFDALAGIADEWEVVVVDDGSTDDTSAVVEGLSGMHGLRLVQLSRNFGKEPALSAGLAAARGDIVVLMDADLQHPPALIAVMVAHWRAGADVVYAVRSGREDECWSKRAGTHIFYSLLNHFERLKLPEDAGDFRVLDRRAVDALLSLPERTRFMKGLYAWIGFDAVAVPYQPQPRLHGTSRFGARRLLRLSLDGLTAFTSWPLRVAGGVGILCALAGFVYGTSLAVSYLLYGNPVSGWTTIVVTLLFFFGLQMIFLGILGEYVARVFDEVKHRPLFLVKREAGRGLPPRSTR